VILRDDNRSIEQTWNMKKWYSFYTSYEDFGDAVNALSGQMDISSLNCSRLLQKFHSRRYSDLSLGDIILR